MILSASDSAFAPEEASSLRVNAAAFFRILYQRIWYQLNQLETDPGAEHIP